MVPRTPKTPSVVQPGDARHVGSAASAVSRETSKTTVANGITPDSSLMFNDRIIDIKGARQWLVEQLVDRFMKEHRGTEDAQTP